MSRAGHTHGRLGRRVRRTRLRTRTTGIADIVAHIVSPPQRGCAGPAVRTTKCPDLASHPRPIVATTRSLGTDNWRRLGARRLRTTLFRAACRRIHLLRWSLPVRGLDRACLDSVVISGTSIASGRASSAVATTVARASAARVLLGCSRRFGRLVLGLMKGGRSSGSRHGGRGRCPTVLTLCLSLSLGLERARRDGLLSVGVGGRLERRCATKRERTRNVLRPVVQTWGRGDKSTRRWEERHDNIIRAREAT